VRREDVVAERTAAWTDAERTALAVVVEALRPSQRHLGDALDWLDDIAARDGVRPAAVLAAPTLAGALASPGSAPDRLKRWKEALRRLRYPRLVAREQAFAAAVRALELGRGVAIAPPAALEGGMVILTIRAGSAAELDAILVRLVGAGARGDLVRLFALI
jgi:hypothetical protein